MALERVAVHLPLAHNRLDGALRPQDHEDQAQGHLSGHDDPLQDADLGPLLLVRVDVVPHEHDNRHHPARQWGEGGTEEVDGVAEEWDEVGEEPSTSKGGDHHCVPCCHAALPLIIGVGILLLGLREDRPAEDNSLDQVRDQHVNHQAGCGHLERGVEGQVLVDHPVDLVPQVVVASDPCNHEGDKLEGCRDLHVRLWQLAGILHL
mmetsp:Transcript_109403/g.282823  ORF Transcript_109403/g.282823 Transcript_109403/m.282823 type:complete len:206 (+) Transcript_109403:439-1056(+)